ncbi:MAG TPA: radical SAM protein [candidate division WOR-3 bacterium]|uniref:Radical SAM protein n=1 Tax=candidate division WOR-3 bacterium TaxID=2052148 RepID=A0A9C9K0Q8_UNCW3|nr:radical SAM protein [candidate division WOR-3 bacterium]
MRYYGTVIRPPSEAASYLLQITYGCSHNKCTFCPTYLDKPFKVRPQHEVFEDIQEAQRLMPDTRRVFLCDGNAMVLNTEYLTNVLKALETAFPALQRVGIYANAHDILRKSIKELRTLVAHRLTIIYIGLESGSDKVLKKVCKGATAREIIQAVQKAQQAGFKVSVIALLGLGGTDLWKEHAVSTGRAISEMNPRYFSLLTLMLVPGTILYEQQQKGDFILPDPLTMLKEMRVIIEHTEMKRGCIFRSNHASNYLPLAGTLPKDKTRLLETIDLALKSGTQSLRPEYLRGL